MSKIRQTLLSASSAMAIAMLVGVAAPGARAADVAQVCQPWAGTVTAGYIFGDHDSQFSGKGSDFETDFGTFFGEGEALYHFCDTNLNVQGDGAFHNHQYDDSSDSDNERWHLGGILFWRNQDVGVLGLDVSFLNDELFDESAEIWRLGVRGEYFGGDMFTLGAGAGYLNGEFFFGKNTDGFDVNAWGRIYPTENIGLLARFDYATQDLELIDFDIDHWAIGGEGEYLLPSLPVSIFAGARYGETDIDTGKSDFVSEVTEIYAGVSIYFGSDGNGGSLASHHRNNTLDNTSVIFERLPNFFAGKSSP